MARKKKELALEEKMENKKQCELKEIKNRLTYINEPSYFFNVGDEVKLGQLKQCIVDEVLYGGKVYGLKCIVTENNYGNPYDYETYRFVAWHEIRPLEYGNTRLANNKDVKLYFNSCSIQSLLFKYYHFGVDMDPEYQRGYVWEDKDKELLLDSVFNNIDIGKFVFVHLSDTEWLERGVGYEILDGKQRLSTLMEFYENKISYKGKYYNDLSESDRRAFNNHDIALAEISENDKQTVLKYFLMLNRTGKSMDESHLKEVEKMLEEQDGKIN